MLTLQAQCATYFLNGDLSPISANSSPWCPCQHHPKHYLRTLPSCHAELPLLQYCATVMRVNFDEIRALFLSKFRWKFRVVDMRKLERWREIQNMNEIDLSNI